VDFKNTSRKQVGAYGELAVTEYLKRRGATVIGRNIAWKTGELDIVARHNEILHFVEVKAMLCETFPTGREADRHDPTSNLHAVKIRKVARTAEWFVMQCGWEGEWQIDGAVVWIRSRDGLARIRYYPQVL
jgi:putative endonuclease